MLVLFVLSFILGAGLMGIGFRLWITAVLVFVYGPPSPRYRFSVTKRDTQDRVDYQYLIEEKQKMEFSSFIKKEGRALPVFLLVDTSGSMQGEKIETVNVALKEMISVFRKIENPKGVINLCIITFGNGNIQIVKPLSEITDTDYYEFSAEGNTPMGAAFEKIASMIEDYNIVSSRSYIPTIVLISDGNPTDFTGYNESMLPEEIKAWPSLRVLHGGARSSKAVKLAMGIGQDMDMRILGAFINNDSIPVIKAQDNGTISKFFEWVTMSIRVRSVSVNPDVFNVDVDSFDKDEIEWP